MAGEISPHSLPIPVVLSCIEFIGSSILVLLVPVITEMDLASFSRLSVQYIRRVLFETRPPLESDDAFFH